MSSYKAAVLREYNTELVFEEKETPVPAAGEVVVKVMSNGLCSSDLHIQDGKVATVTLPYTPGHEIAGIVWETGEGVTHVAKGDHVVVAIDVVCGNCRYCRTGRTNLCVNLKRIGFERSGGYGEYALIPASNAIKIDKSVPFEAAALLPDSLACMYHTIKTQAQVSMGDRVLLLGTGGLGLNGIQIVKGLGAQLFATSRHDSKLEVATKLGADAVINTSKQNLYDEVKRLTDGMMCDVVLDNIGIQSSINTGLSVLRPGGKLIIVGYIDKEFSADMQDVMLHEKEIIGTRASTRQDLVDVVGMVERGILTPVVFRSFKLNEINEAFKYLRSGEALGKLVVNICEKE